VTSRVSKERRGGGDVGKGGDDLSAAVLGNVQLVNARQGKDFLVGDKGLLTDLALALRLNQMPRRLEPRQVLQRLKRRHPRPSHPHVHV
jgi:hypothetical protein